MKKLAALIAIGAATAACGGGQSAQQKLTARCEAQAQQWAQTFVAPFADQISAKRVEALTQSATSSCIRIALAEQRH